MRIPILTDYHKILQCISSCKEERQLKNCENMVDDFNRRYPIHKSREILSEDLFQEIELHQSNISTTTTTTTL